MTAIPAELTARQCAATKHNGAPCTVDPQLLIEDEETPGVYWCYSHHPDLAEQREASRSLAGARTAIRNRKNKFLDKAALGPLKTPEDAMRWSATVAEAVATGTLNGSAARSTLAGVELFVRSLEVVDLNKRLAQLEQRVEEDESRRAREAKARAAEARRAGVPYVMRDVPTGNGS